MPAASAPESALEAEERLQGTISVSKRYPNPYAGRSIAGPNHIQFSISVQLDGGDFREVALGRLDARRRRSESAIAVAELNFNPVAWQRISVCDEQIGEPIAVEIRHH